MEPIIFHEMYALEEELIHALRKILRIEKYDINYKGMYIRFQNTFAYKFTHEQISELDNSSPTLEVMAINASRIIEDAYLKDTIRWK